jgi:pyridoxamine 5'-phosphate oxidase
MENKIQNNLATRPYLPPENLIARVWQELTRATKDRHHDWKTPAFASIGLDGNPQARTIVLRNANKELWTLSAYTDLRSTKCQELEKHGLAQLVFWSKKLRWQLRVSVNVSIHAEGNLVESVWTSVSQSNSSKDYLSNQAPGSLINFDKANEAHLLKAPVRHNLAVLSFQVISMDWLALGKDFHRRAQIYPNGAVTPVFP